MSVSEEDLRLAARLLRDPQLALATAEAEQVRRSGERSFAAFVRQAWPIVDQRPLIWTWYLAALATHLEAVARGRISRLVGNGPPRNGKSNLFAILWPAWIWTWNPSEKFIYLSYSDDLVTEHSVKCRAVIESAWYQDTYRPKWRLGHSARDGAAAAWRLAHGNRQDDFVNSAGGRRIASSIKAGVTGRGATIIAIDDPLSAEEATSKAARELARRTVIQTTSTRFDDARTGRAALLMQRVHADDPSQWAIDAGWTHFSCPMEYVPESSKPTYELINGEKRELWRDLRREPGESLSPERFPRAVLEQIRLAFGPISYAAQYQQAPRRGASAGLFQRAWFASRFLDARLGPHLVARRVRRWDLASTEGAGDWTVGVLLAQLRDGSFVVEDVQRRQFSPRRVRELVRATAEVDGSEVEIVVPQDPGQAGKDQVQEYASMLVGFTVRSPRETGDKVTRAGPASAQCEAGNVALVRAPWNEPFIACLEAFPEADHDDDVDAFSGAVAHFSQVRTTFEEWMDAEF